MTILKLDINRRDYEVVCNEGEEEHILALSFELDRRVKDLYKVAGTANPATLLMMAGLQLVEEIYQLKNGGSDDSSGGVANILSQVAGRLENISNKLEKKAS